MHETSRCLRLFARRKLEAILFLFRSLRISKLDLASPCLYRLTALRISRCSIPVWILLYRHTQYTLGRPACHFLHPVSVLSAYESAFHLMDGLHTDGRPHDHACPACNLYAHTNLHSHHAYMHVINEFAIDMDIMDIIRCSDELSACTPSSAACAFFIECRNQRKAILCALPCWCCRSSSAH